MKIKREVLLEELRFVSRAAGGHGAGAAVLSHALWRVGPDGRLLLKATDAQTTMSATLDVEGAVEGESLAVPCAESLAMLGGMFDDEVEVTLEEKAWRAVDGSSRVRLDALPAEEFPEQPPLDDREEVSLRADRFLAALAAVNHAGQATGPMKNTAAGFLLSVGTDGALSMAATDGHRLAISGSLETLAGDSEAIRLSPDAGKLLELLERPKSGAWALRRDEHRVEVSSPGGRSISLRRIEGAYPNVAALVSKMNPPHSLTVDRASLLARARSAASCPGISDYTVVMTAGLDDGAGLELLGRGPYSEVRVQVPAKLDGPAIKMAVNGNYLVELLESIVGKDIAISYESPDKPLFYAAPPTESNPVGEWRVVAQKAVPQ